MQLTDILINFSVKSHSTVNQWLADWWKKMKKQKKEKNELTCTNEWMDKRINIPSHLKSWNCIKQYHFLPAFQTACGFLDFFQTQTFFNILYPLGSKIWQVWHRLIQMTVKLTRAPPCGWWTITLAWGKACLNPGVPAVNNREPMLHAWPIHHVEIGGWMY